MGYNKSILIKTILLVSLFVLPAHGSDII